MYRSLSDSDVCNLSQFKGELFYFSAKMDNFLDLFHQLTHLHPFVVLCFPTYNQKIQQAYLVYIHPSHLDKLYKVEAQIDPSTCFILPMRKRLVYGYSLHSVCQSISIHANTLPPLPEASLHPNNLEEYCRNHIGIVMQYWLIYNELLSKGNVIMLTRL